MKILITILFLSSAPAIAQSTTEFFHQPLAGISEFTLHGGYRTVTFRATPEGSQELNGNGLDRVGIGFDYGLNPLIALGFDFAYSSLKVAEGGGELRGIEPLKILLNGQLPLSDGSLQYGFAISFALEKATSETALSNRSYGDVAVGSPAGGFKLRPYLGYVYVRRFGTIGATLSYDVVSSDESAAIMGQDANIGGASHGWGSLFYETRAADISLGAALLYDWFTRSYQTLGASSETTLTPAHSLVGAKFYAVLPMVGWEFLPSFSWRQKASNDAFDKTNDLNFTIAARFAL